MNEEEIKEILNNYGNYFDDLMKKHDFRVWIKYLDGSESKSEFDITKLTVEIHEIISAFNIIEQIMTSVNYSISKCLKSPPLRDISELQGDKE